MKYIQQILQYGPAFMESANKYPLGAFVLVALVVVLLAAPLMLAAVFKS